MAVDDVVRTFFSYEGLEFLPNDPGQLDSLVRYSVRKLRDEPEKSKRILEDVNPGVSARYLVGALSDTSRRDAAKEILLTYGPSYTTVNPLGGALANRDTRDFAKKIFIEYGAANATAGALLGMLRDLNTRDVARDIFISYGPSNVTVKKLVAGVQNPSTRDIASEVFMSYGRRATRYLTRINPGSPGYASVFNVIEAIKTQPR